MGVLLVVVISILFMMWAKDNADFAKAHDTETTPGKNASEIVQAYKNYLSKHGRFGNHVDRATEGVFFFTVVTKENEWQGDIIEILNAYRKYLKDFPDGFYQIQTQQRILKLAVIGIDVHDLVRRSWRQINEISVSKDVNQNLFRQCAHLLKTGAKNWHSLYDKISKSPSKSDIEKILQKLKGASPERAERVINDYLEFFLALDSERKAGYEPQTAIDAYQAYLRNQPERRYAKQASDLIYFLKVVSNEDIERAFTASDIDRCRDYLKAYPEGPYAALAQDQLDYAATLAAANTYRDNIAKVFTVYRAYLVKHPSGFGVVPISKKKDSICADIFRKDFWQQAEIDPASNVRLLNRIQQNIEDINPEVGTYMQKLQMKSDIFLQIPDGDWSDFAYRHGKIPVVGKAARLRLTIDMAERAIETKQYGSYPGISVQQKQFTATVTVKDGNDVICSKSFADTDPPLPNRITVRTSFGIPMGYESYHTARAEHVMKQAKECQMPLVKSPCDVFPKKLAMAKDEDAFSLGCYYLVIGKSELGCKKLREVIKKFPNNEFTKEATRILDPFGETAQETRAEAARIQKAYDEALEAATIGKQFGDIDNAIRIYEKYIKDYPNSLYVANIHKEIICAVSERFRKQFWERIKQSPARRDVQLLMYIQKYLEGSDCFPSAEMGQVKAFG